MKGELRMTQTATRRIGFRNRLSEETEKGEKVFLPCLQSKSRLGRKDTGATQSEPVRIATDTGTTT